MANINSSYYINIKNVMEDIMIPAIFIIILRATLAFFLLLILTRWMGRKVMSQMTFFDFAETITLGSVAANLALSKNNSAVLHASIVLIVLASLEVITGISHIKSFIIDKLVSSEPVTLIENGEIIKSNMKKLRLTITELTSMLRQNSIFNIADVEFAIIETNGRLSIQPKSQKQPLTPSDLNLPTLYKGLTKDLIIDGQILHENLTAINLDELWLTEQLTSKGIDDIKDVFFAALDTCGNLYVSKGITGQEQEGTHGIE